MNIFLSFLILKCELKPCMFDSNSVEVMNFSGFFTQLQKFAFITARIIASRNFFNDEEELKIRNSDCGGENRYR